ncbi:MAG TPA: FAD-dependent oxidoreductase [Tepidisphaeraceae bacterium]|nr:FAD-dependent oxidoreductase [Tepidisphaeraceae bacterium]
MSSSHFQYVLVGGGAAASAAAHSIRQTDPVGSILLVGQEHNRPYMRPALSKEYLLKQQSRIEIVSEPVGWFIQQHVELRTGRRVSQLDTARQTICIDDGEEVAFDRLLIATGASSKPLKVPGADLPNVFYLRTIEDCDRLLHAMDKAKLDGRAQPQTDSGTKAARGKAAVVGGGPLAIEVAAALKLSGLHVDLLVEQPYPWGKYAGENTGRFFTRYLESKDLAVRVDAVVERIEGDGRAQRVMLSDGPAVDCDFVVVAIGIVPNRELVRATPIVAEKAILADSRCQTNISGIYAAGDCAAVFDPLFGKHRMLEHWDSARLTGAIAGANMAGVEMHYNDVNSFTSPIFDLTMTVWGERRQVNHRLMRGTPSLDSIEFFEIGVAADGRVAQVLASGCAEQRNLLRFMVEKRLNVNGLEEKLKDPHWDLSQLNI